mgnify:CR=1 FL=1|jgi:hypothetical protein|tara:strand:+ start:470 stop:778 length:309 start_codon:yes stop_codon:yes gene_type:complete
MDFFYFQTGSDDATAFPVKDIVAIDASSAAVTVYFGAEGGTLLSNVALTVTAGQEEAVVQALCGFASSRVGYGRLVIADDANSTYAHSGITACGAISLDVSP